MNGSIPKCEKVIVQNEPPAPVCILGDLAYPLLHFLMKEFANGGKLQWERFYGFDYRLPEWLLNFYLGDLKRGLAIYLKRDPSKDTTFIQPYFGGIFTLRHI